MNKRLEQTQLYIETGVLHAKMNDYVDKIERSESIYTSKMYLTQLNKAIKEFKKDFKKIDIDEVSFKEGQFESGIKRMETWYEDIDYLEYFATLVTYEIAIEESNTMQWLTHKLRNEFPHVEVIDAKTFINKLLSRENLKFQENNIKGIIRRTISDLRLRKLYQNFYLLLNEKSSAFAGSGAGIEFNLSKIDDKVENYRYNMINGHVISTTNYNAGDYIQMDVSVEFIEDALTFDRELREVTIQSPNGPFVDVDESRLFTYTNDEKKSNAIYVIDDLLDSVHIIATENILDGDKIIIYNEADIKFADTQVDVLDPFINGDEIDLIKNQWSRNGGIYTDPSSQYNPMFGGNLRSNLY